LTEKDVVVDEIISNEMVFSPTPPNKLINFSPTLVHMYNKNLSMASAPTKTIIDSRSNCLLLGDGLGDATMSDGMDVDPDKTLKIGFLNNDLDSNIDKYMGAFDLVIVGGDENFYFVNELLKAIVDEVDTDFLA